MYRITTLVVFIGLLVAAYSAASGYNEAMNKCMEKHSYSTCVYSLR